MLFGQVAHADWITVALQAGGAIAVCGMFLWFLQRKQVADDAARKEFLDHLAKKDASQQAAIDRNMTYMQSRDQQSKEIAISGHDALREISSQVQQLRTELAAKKCPTS